MNIITSLYFISEWQHLVLISKSQNSQKQKNELKQKFDKADTDHNGKLDKNEITEVLKSQNLPTDNVDMIMKIGDINHDGGISFEEFINILKLIAQLKAAQIELCKKLFA